MTDEKPVRYRRPEYAHAINHRMTPDGQLLLINTTTALADRREWRESNGITMPPRFAVSLFGPTVKEATVHYEYEYVLDPDGVLKLRSALVTGLGGHVPTAEDFRNIRPDDVRRWALEFFEVEQIAGEFVLPHHLKDSKKAKRYPSGRAVTAADLSRVAELYAEALDDADRTNPPAVVIAAALGCSPSTADRRIRAARKAGLITEAARTGRRPE